MSETPTVGQFARAAADLCGHEWAQTDGACVGCTAKAIAAAEERGRRAGIEEAEKALWEHRRHGGIYVGGTPEEIVRALAPRDSGKEQT